MIMRSQSHSCSEGRELCCAVQIGPFDVLIDTPDSSSRALAMAKVHLHVSLYSEEILELKKAAPLMISGSPNWVATSVSLFML